MNHDILEMVLLTGVLMAILLCFLYFCERGKRQDQLQHSLNIAKMSNEHELARIAAAADAMHALLGITDVKAGDSAAQALCRVLGIIGDGADASRQTAVAEMKRLVERIEVAAKKLGDHNPEAARVARYKEIRELFDTYGIRDRIGAEDIERLYALANVPTVGAIPMESFLSDTVPRTEPTGVRIGAEGGGSSDPDLDAALDGAQKKPNTAHQR
ncbi:hypothetical protein KBB27_02265 [Patescibacteria group bacterium]|nr:hypothetical protein [Patescibacteria group bacterium]